MDRVEKSIISKFSRWILPVSLLSIILFWEGLTDIGHIPSFFLPSPWKVGQRFIQAFLGNNLFIHTSYTLAEVISGLLIGSSLATILGYLIAKSSIAEKLLAPYLVASQAVPTVAIAPLLIIWFGSGIYSKILICALIVFFPILVNTIVGVRAVSKDLYDLMISLEASRFQILRYLEIPGALPVFLGGLRIGATLSVIGAVVGEFVGADHGLGFLINVGRGQYDTALVFVAIIMLVVMALSLYGIVILMEKRMLIWQK